jgi:hypothetical protein
MISDAALAEVFAFELERSRDVEAAIHVVRRTVEAYCEHADHRERRPPAAAPRPLAEAEVMRVAELVAADVHLSLDGILRAAGRPYLHARWVVAAVLRGGGASYRQIARALGMLDHTRALLGIRAVDATPALAGCRDRVLALLTSTSEAA